MAFWLKNKMHTFLSLYLYSVFSCTVVTLDQGHICQCCCLLLSTSCQRRQPKLHLFLCYSVSAVCFVLSRYGYVVDCKKPSTSPKCSKYCCCVSYLIVFVCLLRLMFGISLAPTSCQRCCTPPRRCRAPPPSPRARCQRES